MFRWKGVRWVALGSVASVIVLTGAVLSCMRNAHYVAPTANSAANNAVIAVAPKTPAPAAPAAPKAIEWREVWREDFKGAELDRTIWTPFVTGSHNDWYAARFEDSPETIRVQNGVLKLIARQPAGSRIISGYIETRHTKYFLNGRIEARIKMAKGKGSTSAFWAMPEHDAYGLWPNSGEFDVVEQIGRLPHQAHGTLHFQGEGRYTPKFDYGVADTGHIDAPVDLSDDFHTYAVEWDPGQFRWFFDGQLYHTTKPWRSHLTEAPGIKPFDKPFFLILMLAGGNRWEGKPDATTPWPMVMEVDWVSVSQKVEPPQQQASR